MKARVVAICALFACVSTVVALPDLKPQVEARGKKEPVELVLRLYKNRIKADESLWAQIELRNIGKKAIVITDDLFFKSWPIQDHSDRQTGVYVEVFDASGKPVKPRPAIYDFEPSSEDLKPASGDSEEGKKADRMISEWKRSGLSKAEIDAKLRDYDRDQGENKRSKERGSWKVSVLPGDSRRSHPWAHPDRNPSDEELSTLPVGQFSELKYYFNPGKYTIRAVFDYRLPERLKKIAAADETNILLRTKALAVEVVK